MSGFLILHICYYFYISIYLFKLLFIGIVFIINILLYLNFKCIYIINTKKYLMNKNATLKCFTMKYIQASAHAMYFSESLTLETIL